MNKYHLGNIAFATSANLISDLLTPKTRLFYCPSALSGAFLKVIQPFQLGTKTTLILGQT